MPVKNRGWRAGQSCLRAGANSANITSAGSSHPSPFRGTSGIRHSWECRLCWFPRNTAFSRSQQLYPFRLKGVARLCLFVRAPFLLLLRAAFGLALPRDIESRRGVCDRGGVQESQNDDWQVNQHFPGILGQTRLLGGRFGWEPVSRRMAVIHAHR